MKTGKSQDGMMKKSTSMTKDGLRKLYAAALAAAHV
jgi:hypothetical protein